MQMYINLSYKQQIDEYCFLSKSLKSLNNLKMI